MGNVGRSFYAALVAGAVALGGFTMSVSAAPLAPNLGSGVQAAAGGDVLEIQHNQGHHGSKNNKHYKKPKHNSHGNRHYRNNNKRWAYNSHRHGHRYKHRRHGYNYYYGGYYYAQPWWTPAFGFYGGPTIVIRP